VAYIGQSITEGTRRAYNFTATAGQTTFNAVYSIHAVDVYQNGILLAPSDYTATSGTSIVLAVAAALDDEITIICHNTFSVADAPTLSGGGTFASSIRATLFDSEQHKTKLALFQTNDQTLSNNVTIASTENASCNGPLSITSGVTLTISGNLTII
jgi:hypothetical protein|tara:strand:+ start:178 stop:645 length:468 start_codon:yes stop_codon:yes gene_type:complete